MLSLCLLHNAMRLPRKTRCCVAAGTAAAAAMPGGSVWAFDFDGVVCDSVGESSLSAWRAAEAKWLELFGTEAARAQQDRVVEGMRVVRPVVETG